MSDIAKVREMSDKELTDAEQAKQDLWKAASPCRAAAAQAAASP